MRAKRWALTTALSAALLTAPAPREVEVLNLGAADAYAAKCTYEICVEIDLKLISAKVCYSRETNC